MKLVIGTRHWRGPDWTHLDIDSAVLTSDDGIQHRPEIVCDATKVPLPDQSCEMVFSSEALEHFSWLRVPTVVKEWARLIEPGGVLHIAVPDFLAACKQVLDADTLEMDLAIQQIIFGGQINLFDFHFAGLTHRTLPKFFEDAGLRVTDIGRGWERGWLVVEGTRD